MNPFNKQEKLTNCAIFINIERKNISLPVGIVQDPSSRSLGSTEVTNRGFVYKFENEGILKFFMSSVKRPVDIIFVSSRMHITHIERSVFMEGMGKGMVVTSKKKAMYVLEVPGGFTRKNNIDVGDTVRILV